MTAINQNLTCYADRTSILIIPIYQADGVTPYTSTTPTSAEWVLAVNNRSQAVLTKTTPGGITLAQSAGLWTATVTINPVDTQSLNPQLYYHELSVVDNVGDVVNVTIGTMNLQPSVAQY